MDLIRISRRLRREVDQLEFQDPVAYVYNPLDYARKPGELYLERFGAKKGRVVMVGMNPGPFGMAQTGVPFGEIGFVRDWMGISGTVRPPKSFHPKRPVQGFDCHRSEVSGARLWGWAKERFGTPERFFDRFFVLNYCPLAFVEDTGRNRTPDKLPAHERDALYEVCDRALAAALDALAPQMILGIGGFARKRVEDVLGETSIPVGGILHPSPASPKANRGWAKEVERELAALGIDV